MMRMFKSKVTISEPAMNPSKTALSLLFSTASAVLVAGSAQAQLVTGIELGSTAYRSNQQTSPQLFNRDSGTISGFKAFFGAQRNWESPGWIVGLAYQGGTVGHEAQTTQGITVGSVSKVHLIDISANLHIPLTDVAGFTVSGAPRINYRAQSRSVQPNQVITALKEDLSEGAVALGVTAHTLINQFGFKATLELERSLFSQLTTQFSPLYAEAAFRPNGAWRPQLDIAGWYQWTPRHRFTLQARFEDLGTGKSEAVTVAPIFSNGPSIVATSQGQKVRTSTLNAGWSYHF